MLKHRRACKRQSEMSKESSATDFAKKKEKQKPTGKGKKHDDTWRRKFESNLGMPCGKATHFLLPLPSCFSFVCRVSTKKKE